MGQTARFQETLRRLAMIDEGFVEDEVGLGLGPAPVSALDPKTAALLAELAAGQQPGQRSQHRTVGPRQPRGLDLTLEDGKLVTQDQDLRILGAIGAGKQG